MSPIEIGILGILALSVLLLLRVHVGIALIAAAVIGSSLLTSPGLSLETLGGDIVGITRNFNLSAIPLFILMERMLKTSVSSLRLPVLLIAYAFLSGGYIAPMLISGILPAALVAALLFTVFYFLSKTRSTPVPEAFAAFLPFKLRAFLKAMIVPAIYIVSLGGIFFGFFNPTQAGAVGSALAIIYALSSGRLDKRGIGESFLDAAKSAAPVFIMLIGGSLFGLFMSRSLIHITLIRFIAGLGLPTFFVIMLILLLYAAIGLVTDHLAGLVLLTPIIFPVVRSLGYNGVVFGVLAIIALMAARAPQLGLAQSSNDDSAGMQDGGAAVASRLPVVAAFAIAGLMTLGIPAIATLLPRMMF